MVADGPGGPAVSGNSLEIELAALVAANKFDHDPAQILLVRKLDQLLLRLEDDRLASKQSALGWLFSNKQSKPAIYRGLYIWGPVGRGKTMLMDLFYGQVKKVTKRRVHFHDFLQDVHARIHLHRQMLKRGEVSEPDPILPVARALASEARLLCLDEFSVNDAADAMILSRLFTGLFDCGVTIVITSNTAPDALYPHGLNRDFFLKFVKLLKQNVETFWLDAKLDFRLEKLARVPVFILNSEPAADVRINRIWQELTGCVVGGREKLLVKGRELIVPQASNGAARFSFDALCGAALGAADYLALAARYHSLFVDNIPQMDRDKRNEAKRFIILIDALYDSHVNLICTAAVAPTQLYTATSGVEHLEFKRTASRLVEMQSLQYLQQGRNSKDQVVQGGD